MLGRLPLFVLPSVLFPGARKPLHVFEARYRQLVARCLEGDGRFGVLYHDARASGPFQLVEGRVGCVAEIVEHEALGDGRSLIQVVGRDRFRIEDGIESGTPYPEGLAAEYADEPAPRAELVQQRGRTIDLFHDVLERAAEPGSRRPRLDPGDEVSFRIAERLPMEPLWRQALLESVWEVERLERVDAVLRSVLDRYEEGR